MKKSLFVYVVFQLTAVSIQVLAKHNRKQDRPVNIKLAIPDNIEMVVGDSRIIEVIFYSGNDDLDGNNFKVVTERDIEWGIKSTDGGEATVDKYGRFKAVKEGNDRNHRRIKSSTGPTDKKTIQIVDTPTIDKMQK